MIDCGAHKRSKAAGACDKIVERVIENRIRGMVNTKEMQFGFIPRKGTTHALFSLRRMQEEFRRRVKKLHMCFVDMKKKKKQHLDRPPRKVMEWALRKKRLSEALV